MGAKMRHCLILAVLLHVATSARILSILPAAVRSHSILYDRLMNELANRGHKVTFITPFGSKKVHENITEIRMPDLRKIMMGDDTSILKYRNIPVWVAPFGIPYVSYKLNHAILGLPGVKELIDAEPFDLIFGEPFMDEAIVAAFSYRHKAPLVVLSTLMPNTWSNYISGNPSPSSYIADPLLAYPSQMTFCQRLNNFLFTLTTDLIQKANLFLQDRVMRQHFGDDLPFIDEILRNTSLVLSNNHPSISFPRPQLQNTIDVAGMHIYPPKPLPKDIEDFMNKSENGVILFSLGTNVNSSDLSPEKIQEILRGLGRLKQNVLWKFETELKSTPSNVRVEKWLPQSDILAHPNLKLFITHGGMLSTTEAFYRGVPIVGMPIFADQPNNMKHNENAGIGITLSLDDLNENTLYEAATEVLTNPKYRDAVKQKSKVLHDEVLPPLERAVWWIEYVMRQKGAPHLRSSSHNLYWFQLYQIDVLLTVACVALVLSSISFCVTMKIVRRICSKNGNALRVSKKKKNK